LNGASATILVQATATNIGTFPNVAVIGTSDPSFFEVEPANNVSATPLRIVKPELHIRRVNDTVELFWDKELAGFDLEGTAELFPPAWDQVSPAPFIVGDQNVVTNNASLANRFYRLKQP
jgi:hypothetical protein